MQTTAQEIVAAMAEHQRVSVSAAELVKEAKENPPKPIIDGLLCERDILLIHGTEESYKSTLVLQIAESIASSYPLLRRWFVPQARRVGIIETEMHPAQMGERLGRMFPNGQIPERMLFLDEATLRHWRRRDLSDKFAIIEEWIRSESIEVLIIDTANDFFRGKHNASVEGDVGEFFDLMRNLRLQAQILVRHDRKQRASQGSGNPNDLIRGSAEWKEDPETILYIRREDRRTNEASLDIGKLRYGRKPDNLRPWFDVQSFRLTPLPPIVAILEGGERKTRQQIIEESNVRFGLAARSVDAMLEEEEHFLIQGTQGHNATFALNADTALDAPWAEFLRHPA